MLQKAGGLFQLLSEVDFGTSHGVKSLYFSSRTANIADAGQIRLARADVISFRNEANSANLDLGVNSSDVLTFNGVAVGNFVTVSDTSTIDLTLSAGDLSAAIIAGSITNSLISASAAIDFSKLAALSSGNILVGSVSNVATSVAMSGDATISNTGALTIANNAVSNAKLAQMATLTIKGNNTGGNSDPLDLSVSQVTAMLNNFVGDSGSGGTKGLVPAPASGDAALDKYLKADGTWTTPAGAGDVVGPASSTVNAIAKYADITGKLLLNSGITIDGSDVLSGATQINVDNLRLDGNTLSSTNSNGNINLTPNGSGNVVVDNLQTSGSSGIVFKNSGGTQVADFGPANTTNVSFAGNVNVGGLTANRAVVSGASKTLTSSATTDTQIGYLSNTTSDIQAQLDAKQARSTLTTKGDLYAATASATTDRLAAGANGFVLKANSGTTTGLEYGVGNNSSNAIINGTITASVAGNALTIELKTLAGTDPSTTDPVFVYFKNNSNTVATYSLVTITSALSITVPSGATLGQRDGNYSYIYVFLINNAGVAELAVSRSIRDDSYPRNTIVLDTSSDSSADIYSTSARTNVSLRLIGIVGNTQTTAGAWATAPSYITGQGFLRTMPEMIAYISSQAVTSGNDIVYTTLVRDRLNGYDVSTGIYTIRERGAYVAIASAATGGIASGAASNFFLILLIKTGSPALTIAGNRDAADASVTRTFSSVATMYFLGNAGDTIKVQMQENIGAGSLDGNEQRNYFMVYKVSDLGF
jgi:hypothetical protein